MSSQEPDVIFENVNNVGILTMNRPQSLNALNLSMVQSMLPKLLEWEKSKALVIIKGAGGKAFCAGGDVKAILTRKETAPNDFEMAYCEYNVNYTIGKYKIPFIAIMDGIAMGGGLGVSVHGRYRIATEKTVVAMPETKIGLFPDVGGSYFLPRLKNNLGIYLGLTSEQLRGYDAVKVGIATHFVPREKLPEMEQLLTRCSNDLDVQNVLNQFNVSEGEFSLASNIANIEYCFTPDTVENIYERLRKLNNEWSRRTVEVLNKMCPGSLKITLRELQKGAVLDLGQCLQMEYRMATRCTKVYDFHEGVRALLIDRDNKPQWNPRTLAEVTEEYVEGFFQRLPEDEELKFSYTSKL